MNKKYFVIPGNPAVAGEYISWIDEIKKEKPDLDVSYATSYVIFDRKLNYKKYHDEMIHHYEQTICKPDNPEKIILISHSAGSYFALRLLEKYPEKIEKIIILFPYIGYSTIKLLNFVYIPYYIDRLLPLSETVSACKNILKLWYKDIVNISKTELTANLRFGVRQCTYFIKNKFDIEKIKGYKDRIFFLYAKEDKWCPEQTINLMNPVCTHQETLVPHDFIVSKEHRNQITKTILPHL